MSKRQKVWLGILAMIFVIPELFFQLISNFVYIFLQNSNNPRPLVINFFTEHTPNLVYKLLVFIQLLASALIFITLITNSKNLKKNFFYYLAVFCSLILCIIAGFIFYLITFVNIRFP